MVVSSRDHSLPPRSSLDTKTNGTLFPSVQRVLRLEERILRIAGSLDGERVIIWLKVVTNDPIVES